MLIVCKACFSPVVPVETKGYNMRFSKLPDFKKIENMMKFQRRYSYAIHACSTYYIFKRAVNIDDERLIQLEKRYRYKGHNVLKTKI